MAMPYDWMSIRANGPLPPPSAVGPSSPYWRIQPFSGMAGPASAWPSPAALGSGAGGGSLVQQYGALTRGPMAELGPGSVASAAARGGPGLGVGAGPGLSRMGVPAAARAGASAAAEGVPMFVNGAGAAAGAGEAAAPLASTAARSGLVGTLRSAMGLAPAEAAGFRAGAAGMLGTVGRGVGVGSVGVIGGNMLDESNWLGGSESAANDYASKALKLGGVGAAIGTIFPGIGTAVGAGIGAGVGLGWEGLERAGILSAPTIQEQVDETIHGADNAAREIGVPEEVLSALKAQYQAEKEFVDPGDKAARTTLAQGYADRVQEQALAYAADPNSFLRETTSSNNGGNELQRALIMRSLLVNTIQPYADNYLAQSEATAKSLENMAASAGDLAPMYQQQAASTRQMGGMYAANLVNQAQITPYMQALQDQAGYLNQISQQTMSQAIGSVMQPQQAQAGTTDLTAIIDQATNQLQPQ